MRLNSSITHFGTLEDIKKLIQKPEKKELKNPCSCGFNDKVMGEHYCQRCLDKNPLWCA